jgi:mono/diheme cytochrome c family protein
MKSIISKIAVLGVAALGLQACTGQHNQPNVEIIQDMMESPAIKPQEFDASSEHNRGMRVPPEHTVPVGFEPYKYGNDVTLASKELKNPYAGSNDAEILYTGIKMYETNCALCHGHKGEGGTESSLIVARMALKPPPLLSEKVRGMSDGQLYHIITMGQGVMGSYASQVRQKDRWQLVTYIRQLQKNAK